MRTTLTLDADVVALLREEAARSRQPLKQVVNRALRRGLTGGGAGQAEEPFRTQAHSFGLRPGYDPDRMNQLAGELEDEAALASMHARQPSR